MRITSRHCRSKKKGYRQTGDSTIEQRGYDAFRLFLREWERREGAGDKRGTVPYPLPLPSPTVFSFADYSEECSVCSHFMHQTWVSIIFVFIYLFATLLLHPRSKDVC